jgi:hypothetical protein
MKITFNGARVATSTDPRDGKVTLDFAGIRPFRFDLGDTAVVYENGDRRELSEKENRSLERALEKIAKKSLAKALYEFIDYIG